jgi:predicted GH43/DUF377 family glycosyl hydrolase
MNALLIFAYIAPLLFGPEIDFNQIDYNQLDYLDYPPGDYLDYPPDHLDYPPPNNLDYVPSDKLDYPFSEPKVAEKIEPVQEKTAPSFDPLIDLEEMSEDFILEMKEIEIEDYPYAFNPSIIRWQGSLLMSFRILDSNWATNRIGLVWLDENFNPISTPQILEFKAFSPFFKRQDPRLFTWKGRLFVIYNEVILLPELRRMFLAEVKFDGDHFFTDDAEYFSTFEGERKSRSEKNWVPFEYKGELFLAYSLLPHRILQPTFQNGFCSDFVSTRGSIAWNWGTLRGGTPALRYGNQYLAFFHSTINISSIHSHGKVMPHYFMGAYLFESEPPFKICAISPRPIIGKNFYEGRIYRTWRPIRAIFPAGFIYDDDYIWVVYGRQDHEMWVIKLDKVALLNSLVPVSY